MLKLSIKDFCEMPNMQWTNNENLSIGDIECYFSIIQPWQFSEYTCLYYASLVTGSRWTQHIHKHTNACLTTNKV